MKSYSGQEFLCQTRWQHLRYDSSICSTKKLSPQEHELPPNLILTFLKNIWWSSSSSSFLTRCGCWLVCFWSSCLLSSTPSYSGGLSFIEGDHSIDHICNQIELFLMLDAQEEGQAKWASQSPSQVFVYFGGFLLHILILN